MFWKKPHSGPLDKNISKLFKMYENNINKSIKLWVWVGEGGNRLYLKYLGDCDGQCVKSKKIGQSFHKPEKTWNN